jgi:hypothetical protein
LTNGDSITNVREFRVEWNASDSTTSYTVTERMINFENGKTILKERQKIISRLADLSLENSPFKEIDHLTTNEYTRVKKELVEKGKIEL